MAETVPQGFIPDGFEPDSDSSLIGPSVKPRSKLQSYGGAFMEGIPAATGLAGSMLGSLGGPVVRSAGAAAGGFVGAGLRGLGRRAIGLPEPSDPMEALRAMSVEGAKQGALQGTGEALVGGIKAAVPMLARAGLNPKTQIVDRFGPVWKAMTRERIPVNRSDLSGQAEAGRRMGAALGESRGIVKAAEKAEPSIGVHPVNLLSRVAKLVERMKQLPLSTDERKKLVEMGDQFLGEQTWTAQTGAPATGQATIRGAGWTGQGPRRELVQKADQYRPITLTELLDMRQMADQRAAKLMLDRAQQKAAVDPSLEEMFQKAIADEARVALRKLAPQASASIGRTGEMLGLKTALQHAENRPATVNAINPATWPGLNLLMNPDVLSRMAIGLSGIEGAGPTFAGQQAPRGIEAILRAMGQSNNQ